MKGYVKLESGEIFEGQLSGSKEDIYGEIVFCTGMTGYQEVLTDPSYHGQIVVFTYPLIGNYGWTKTEMESETIQPAGLVLSEAQQQAFHYEAEKTLPEAIAEMGVPLLSNVDTRALVKTVREKGEMGAMITASPQDKDFEIYKPLKTQHVVNYVSVKEPVTFGDGAFHVVVIDFGYKQSTVQNLLNNNCKVTVMPFDSELKAVQDLQPDGILFSDGPGNPEQVTEQLSVYRQLAEAYPTLGICMGHQVLALAFGGAIEKLHFGHRGANQPVQNTYTNKVFMSIQNHSYTVKENSLPKGEFIVQYKNVNDGSIEGLSHVKHHIFTAQFHPDAASADSSEIYEEFLKQLKKKGRERTYA